MRVKELIALLEKIDQDAEIFYGDGDCRCYSWGFYEPRLESDYCHRGFEGRKIVVIQGQGEDLLLKRQNELYTAEGNKGKFLK